MEKEKKYKLIPLIGVVCFPEMPLSCELRRDVTKKSVLEAFEKNEEIVFVTQTKSQLSEDVMSCINGIGCLSRVFDVQENGKILHIQADGLKRVKIQSVEDEKILFCNISEPEIINQSETTINLLMSTAKQNFVELANFDHKLNPELLRLVDTMPNANNFVDAVTVLAVKDETKQLKILNQFDTQKRLELLIEFLIDEIEIAKVSAELTKKVQKNIDQNQKEYYLREQMKVISQELGENDVSEFDEIENKINDGKMPKEAKEKALKELSRLKKLPNSSPDYSVLRNYLDVLLDLPWGIKTSDNKDLEYARKILDEDHSGLEKVKDRIIEYLAVMHLTDKVGAQIICFVGPPGVGKTSVAKSIARALGRNFVKMSVGGVKDESEIRGHRKTYVGAMPGRIIYNMQLAKSINPVFLVDEIDKMANDFRGDPTSAMLEVFDPEQNNSFRDNFLEVPFDLSNVMFIATANNLNDIPAPLKDRMEIIELSGYTASEKFAIAKEHLVKKMIEMHGLDKEKIKIEDETLKRIISEYTYEAGVRNLERQIATICRKTAVKVLNGTKLPVCIKPNDLLEYLGAKKVHVEGKREEASVGNVTGLYWSYVGGGLLTIEVNKVAGDGKIILTGQLGNVMQESGKVALSAVRGMADKLGIDQEIFKKYDIHIHAPEGAVKKDGPSAGVALSTAIYSVFADKKVDNNVAMTGEITIRGNVLPIGGLKEKLLACVRAGITKAIVPFENKEDVAELPKEITENLKIVYAKTLDEVLKNAIVE